MFNRSSDERTEEQRGLDRDAYLFAAGVWFAEFVQWFLRSWSNGSLEAPIQVLEKAAYNIVTFLLTCGIWLILRGRGPYSAWGFIRASAPLVILASGLNTLIGWVLFYRFFMSPAELQDPANFNWLVLAPQPLSYLWVFFCWACFVATVVGAAEARARERALAESHRELQDARLRALRYQIHPHLVFNSLNAIQALLEARQTGAAKQTLELLSRFLRNTLASSTDSLTPLSRELETQRVYLDIEKVRFADRLQVRLMVEPDTREALVPALILQPLVENAIKHGLGQSIDGAEIRIGARRDGDRLHLWVEDDAAVSGPSRPGGFGIGLENTQSRLQTLYGEAGRLEAGPTGEGWRSELILPFEVEVGSGDATATEAAAA
ncbi:hypothetical protein GCM10009422_26010 [Brevundimonas kwangchunensis]|uniref:Signal transduction histidine kinase internal region domain-containing protein n=1 Tax=Brevundimonas kwangchunensis TaxID=322163 RepID=A0ABN1H3B3_9CAUL